MKAQFQDFDDFTETVRGWDLEFRQLDRGTFRAELLQLGTNGAQVVHSRFNRHLRHLGAPPRGLWTFVIPAQPDTRFVSRGQEVLGGRMAIFRPGAEIDGLSWTYFDVYTLSFSEALLTNVGSSMGLPRLSGLIDGREVVDCSRPDFYRLLQILDRVCRKKTEGISRSGNIRVHGELNSELPGRLIEALASSRPLPITPSARMRDRALKRIEDYLDEFPHEPHTVRTLCGVSGASERTLRYAFLERFGLSPKSYLLALRLNGVNRELRRSDPSSTKVGDVANRWGFWHMGQFAADYRKFFGELPSETVGQPRRVF